MAGKKRGGISAIIFFLYVIFGLYFINSAIGYIAIPESITAIDNWIIFIGGILLILSSLNHWRLNRYKVLK